MKNLFFFLFVLTSSVSAQTRPAVVTGRVSAGDTIDITLYEGRSDNTVILYIYDTLYHWHVLERSLSRTGDTAWTTRIALPPATGFVAYKFQVGDSIDNNHDKGYFTMVVRKDGRYMPGAEAGYGLCRSPRYGLGIPGYFSHFSISDTATYMWLSNEVLRNPGARVALVLPYLHAARIFKPQTADAESGRALRYLLSLKDGHEASLLKAWLICRDILHDTLRADSIHRVVIAAFPSGTIARADAYVQTLRARNTEDRLMTASAFIKAYPYRDEQASDNNLLGINYYTVYRTVTSIAIAGKKPEVVFDYQATLPLENLPELYYKAVEIPYDDWKTMDAKTAFPYSEVLYRRMLWYYDHQPASLWYYSPSEWKVWCDRQFKNYFRLHARILMELGRDAEALALTHRAQGLYHYTSSDLDQTEAILLEKAGRSTDLDTLLKTAVRLNQVTAVMIRMLRRGYLRLHGEEKGFDLWFESLKDAHTLQLMKEEIQKQRLNLPATDFSLLDGDGRRIRLSDLRGKTVVLDFWATWCAPCKEAMAGMNMAVKKYAPDTSVVFFFIDTQERITDYKNKALAFTREKGYGFHILFDAGKDMDTTYSAYAHAIQSSGIPFKVVIDPSGFIRFTDIGYKGSPSSLSDEIRTMIELARGSDKVVMGLPYHTDSIVYYNAGLQLGATITYPEKNTGTVVVLLSGTGKQDRDGTMAGHKFFAMIADSLTRRGIVVLRSDDRGLGLSGGNYETSTTTDFAGDAIAAVDYLSRRQDLALRSIGLLGHSEGGIITIDVVKKAPLKKELAACIDTIFR